MMKKILKNKKLLIIICLFLLVVTKTFSRFVYNSINNFIMESQGFYFSSSVLSVDNNEYKINNWDGVSSYYLNVDVKNRKNEYVFANTDVDYDITLECSSNVTCSLSKESGTIKKGSEGDSYIISMSPNSTIKEGEIVTINTTATSTSPYKKKLSATYNIGIEKRGFSYKITDKENNKYLVLDLTNSITYYEVEEAFLKYKVGDKISVDTYKALEKENKAKCYSAIVTISFDPNLILLDMTDSNYKRRIGNEEVQRINNSNYISGFKFKVGATSSEKIKFYKNDITKDYTYPVVNSSSIIKVSVKTVD